MSPKIIAIAAGLVITWLIFNWVIKVLKTSIFTALTIVLLLLILQFFFGIHYQQIVQNLTPIIEKILSLF